MPVALRWLLRLVPMNPITVRLVQNASRRRKHLYVRSIYVAALVLVLLWVLVAGTSGSDLGYRELAAAGSSAFVAIAYLQIGLICVLAPVFMAGAIAQESDPKTWDILLTTPMSQAQIVLGNLFGRLFFVLALLLASLPLFALTQYFGGVPGRSIFASYLVAACAALLVGAIAIALSVSRLAGRRAVFAFYISVVTYLAATAAVDLFLTRTGGGQGPAGEGVTWLTALNPFLALRALLSPSEYPRAILGSLSGPAALFLERPVTAWCVLSSGLSVLLMGASTLTVRAGGLQSVGQGGSGSSVLRKAMGLGAKGAEFRPPRDVWANPIAWREAAARNATFMRILGRWSFIAIGILIGTGITGMFAAGWMTLGTYRFVLQAVVWTEIAVISLIAMNMAATAVSREREDGTLDLILTTPITPGAYLTGKLRGLIAYLVPMLAVPVVTLLAAGGYVLVGQLAGWASAVDQIGVNTNAGRTMIDVPAVLPEAAVIAAVVLVPFTAFCVMVGLQWSLKSKGTIGSVVGTVSVVGVIAGTVGLCGWNLSPSAPLIGPAIGALSPASAVSAVAAPYAMMAETIAEGGQSGMTVARVALAVGAVVAAAIYLAVVYGIHASLVRNFDFTVRKLAGTR
ncbi:MAG: ABC transporter permease subunit [Planctomycetota bacterium]